MAHHPWQLLLALRSIKSTFNQESSFKSQTKNLYKVKRRISPSSCASIPKGVFSYFVGKLLNSLNHVVKFFGLFVILCLHLMSNNLRSTLWYRIQQALCQVLRFGGKWLLEGKDFSFYYMFKTYFSGHNKTWGIQNNLGALPLNAPCVYRPRIQSLLTMMLMADPQKYNSGQCSQPRSAVLHEKTLEVPKVPDHCTIAGPNLTATHMTYAITITMACTQFINDITRYIGVGLASYQSEMVPLIGFQNHDNSIMVWS